MPTLPLFCGPTYQAISPNIDAEDAINLYCEQSESPGAKTPLAMIMAPGKRLFSQLPEAGNSELYTVNGRTFSAGAHLWELGANGVATDLGPLGGTQPARKCMIRSNQTQLLCLNNGNLYVLTLATNVLTAVNMAQFNGPVMQIEVCDGFFFGWLQNSHTWQMSQLEDGLTWSGLDISTISYFPDNIVSFISDHREIGFLSNKKSIAYYNAGAGFPPFIPIQGSFAEYGAGAMSATVQADNAIFWIDADERGQAVARRLVSGYGNQRVSTHAVEFAWQNYSTIADARGYTYQENGHTFWVIWFPTANATWCYDISTGFWHRRGFWNAVSGTYEADHSQSHTFNFGKHLVGDWASGNIYEQSCSIYSDNAGILRWMRRSPTGNKDNKWIYYSALEIDIEPGLGPTPPFLDGAGQPRPPQIMLRWSNDATKTWSSTFLLGCGLAGQYNARARKMQLGRARKRVWEISGTDPIPWRIANAYVQAELSNE